MNFSARPSGDFPTASPSPQRRLRLLGDRHAGLILEAGVVGRRVDRHRRAGRLQPLLLQRGVDVLEGLDQRVEGRIPVRRALAEHDRLRRQRHLLAERIARVRLRRLRGRRRRWRLRDGSRPVRPDDTRVDREQDRQPMRRGAQPTSNNLLETPPPAPLRRCEFIPRRRARLPTSSSRPARRWRSANLSPYKPERIRIIQ